ncbi:hypothetical protein GRX03_09350 [Halovenus sp. WSH3]|uniref:Uncharacterized protein n=1 Tax=Halovenus carboxidivorans TaxID=2692199 RepID=A0A6B0TF45_9EURY|nr:hypothetical protein [Halovenus carboxidivorans]MXR51809.1 hypothetical protein [Halovenus carboxidivorans]
MDDPDDGRDALPDPEEDPPDRTPTVSCSRCDREWDLDYELEELHAGNNAVEQFAMDHYRHTGHYPDDVTPWQVDCRECPNGEQFLGERPARRFARTHARHTRHTVELTPPESETETIQTE